MIITITGDSGSGKSTIGKKLEKDLGFKRYYIGQIRRDAAKEKGMTLKEYNKYGETHPETDLEVDEYQKELGKTQDNFIIEGRTSWFLIPQSLKIYIKVSPKEGARRIFNDLQKENVRNEGKNLDTVEDVLKSNEERARSDDLRYKKYYGKDCFDENNFDFVIDTTNLTVEESYKQILEYIKSNM
jgi:cytidylate kinase